ncbi:hypothetical protein G3823_005015 [Escherichia coli]|nr:hypothetical protein [Escherichia coli]
MAEQTQTATCRVCAGPATKRKQRANESGDNNSHLRGGAGQISVTLTVRDRPPTLLRIAAGSKTFFWECDQTIDR